MVKAKNATSKSPKTSYSLTAQARRLKQPSYKSFRLSKRIRHPTVRLAGSFRLLREALGLIRQHWRLFITITLIYGLSTIILVRGLGPGLNLGELKATLKDGFNGQYGNLAAGAVLFSYLVGSAGSSASADGSVYQTVLTIIVSLATIWTLRQVLAGNKIQARDGFYRGTYPLVPFILVLLVIGLQLVPLVASSWLYSVIISNGIAVTAIEKATWFILFFLLSLFSLYMISSSVFALYIVTLPDMTPMKALRSARQLVRYRRWAVLRKILFLPLALLMLGATIMIPLVLLVTPVAEWIFFFLSMFVLLIVHAYMYMLYRELL